MKRILFLTLFVLFIPNALAISYTYELSLKQQIQNGLTFDEILCPNTSQVLTERPNGKLACVYLDTANHFEWKIQDEIIAENLWVQNHPVIKNCQPKGPDSSPWPDIGYENKTHSFDQKTCQWDEITRN